MKALELLELAGHTHHRIFSPKFLLCAKNLEIKLTLLLYMNIRNGDYGGCSMNKCS